MRTSHETRAVVLHRPPGVGIGPCVGRHFDRASVAILVSCVGLFFAAYLGHLLPYALMELICFGLIGAWIWLFEARLQHVVGQILTE